MSDRKVLLEFIALYKQFPCLWDTKKMDYSNKEARDQAYEVLLEKYKEIQADAIVHDVKKKIDHLRAGYRREHKKVLLSRIKDDDVEYRPQLWYYPNMNFLADVLNISGIEPNEEESSNYRTQKQIKMSPVYLRDREDGDVTYEANTDDGVVDRMDDGIDQMMQQTQDITDPIIQHTQSKAISEAEAFGTTVGLQLKEVHPTQRAIAEKLISDVIFNARFNNLTINTRITLNDKIDNNQFM